MLSLRCGARRLVAACSLPILAAVSAGVGLVQAQEPGPSPQPSQPAQPSPHRQAVQQPQAPAPAPAPIALPQELPLRTPFAADVDPAAPRPEYPRPQMVRDEWLSLNGRWRFSLRTPEAAPAADAASGTGAGTRSGTAAGTPSGTAGGTGNGTGSGTAVLAPPGGDFEHEILVPFACESALSGLMLGQRVVERVRYQRTFRLPQGWRGRRVLLHFEAVDWEAIVRVNGMHVGTHRGGYDRFTCDVTGALRPADANGVEPEQLLEVAVRDPADPNGDGWQPRGKQLGSRGIWYTRTTGIWQSVWLEPVPEPMALDDVRLRAAADGTLQVAVRVRGQGKSRHLHVAVSGTGCDGRPVWAAAHGRLDAPLVLRVPNVRPWSPRDPMLYDVDVTLRDDALEVEDRVRCYAGFRTFEARGGAFVLNDEPLFLRGVLDQGYWPEGGMTAPTDAALRHDVELARAMGFDLVRKHVKVEDARWYHWCDRLGLLVMQDMPSSMNLSSVAAREQFLREMEGMVAKVGSHPSVVHWVAFNEDWGTPGDWQEVAVAHLRRLDPSRPVTDASGWHQRRDPDVIDVHDYGADLLRHGSSEPPERPKILGECGGIAWFDPAHVWSKGWGYAAVATPEAFLRRVNALVQQAFAAPGLAGYVWTQLTDVEQELNGLVHYDRTPKVPLDEVSRVVRGLVRARPRRTVPRWLVLGPMPAGSGVSDARDTAENRAALARALAAEQVPGEAALDPRPGQAMNLPSGRLEWREVEPAADVVDLLALYGGSAEDCVSYAVGTFELREAADVDLLFGSDDAARVWIDGRLVHEVALVRGVSSGDDVASDLPLGPGSHRVVVKVVQGVGGHGFSLWFE